MQKKPACGSELQVNFNVQGEEKVADMGSRILFGYMWLPTTAGAVVDALNDVIWIEASNCLPFDLICMPFELVCPSSIWSVCHRPGLLSST